MLFSSLCLSFKRDLVSFGTLIKFVSPSPRSGAGTRAPRPSHQTSRRRSWGPSGIGPPQQTSEPLFFFFSRSRSERKTHRREESRENKIRPWKRWSTTEECSSYRKTSENRCVPSHNITSPTGLFCLSFFFFPPIHSHKVCQNVFDPLSFRQITLDDGRKHLHDDRERLAWMIVNVFDQNK